MKKIFRSWETYVLVIAVGLLVWLSSGLMEGLKPHTFDKSLELAPFMMIEPKTIYGEIKDWAKIVGQMLTGIGGVGASVRLLVELFRKKKFIPKGGRREGGD